MAHFLVSLFSILLAVSLISPGLLQGAPHNICPEHPRLFFRGGAWESRGLTLAMIQQRAKRPEARPILELLQNSPPNLALRSLLLGEDQSALQVIEELQVPLQWKEITTDEGIDVGWRAMAYDWLYQHAAFTPEKKMKAAENIAAEAKRLIEEMEKSGAHIFHTRMYGWAMGITLAGLALYGDHPQAEYLAGYGYNFFIERLLPARQLQDGTVHNGFGYGRKYTMWLTAHFLSCWYSATGENLWDRIGHDQGDWARRETLFLYYGRLPDKSYLRFGDSYSLFSDNYTFRAIAERAWAYNDEVGWGILDRLIRENNSHVVEKSSAYIYFLFYDPEARRVSPDTLPTKMLFSRQGTGMVIWKSSWDALGTSIFFKCGNYFEDHGHFDQGHLDIYRRAPLLVDSGCYLTFSGPFRTEYWHRSVAHNTILVIDPAIPGDEGGQRVFHSQNDPTMAQYLANHQSETGDIIDYRETNALAYVAGDLTAAYPLDRVERVTRELAIVENRYLVILDRIVTRRDNLVPKVLWHTPVVPRIDKEKGQFEVAREGARLLGSTLLPENPSLEWVEGFVAGGKPIRPEGTLKPIPDMGVGRIEVSRREGVGRQYLFLHVLDIADRGDPPIPATVSQEHNQIKVLLGKRTLAFRENAVGLELD
jgi:hypothetical protein